MQRKWTFDRNARNYCLFADEIKAVISSAPVFSSLNALAIITDSSLMTIGFTLHKFDDIQSTDDEKLWNVDEWDDWHEDWHMDIAYRWLLAYGYHDDLDGDIYEEFCQRIWTTFQDVLKSFADSKDILLIDVGGDDVGHRWSADCMDGALAQRMLAWI